MGGRRRRALIEKSAGGVVVRDFQGIPHMLVIRDPYHMWGLPKGHREKGETSRDAALREVSEETGLSDLKLGPELVTIDWRFRARGRQIHKFATFFLMFSREGEPVPERAEGITEARWVPLDVAHEEISYQNATEVVRAAQDRLLTGRSPRDLS